MKKTLIATIALSAASLAAANAFAASTIVNSQVAVTQTAVSINADRPLNFGTFEITASTANGTIAIGYTNDVTPTTSDLVYNGGNSTARITVSGTPGAPIELTCTSTATLAHETDSTDIMNVYDVGLGNNNLCANGSLATTLHPTTGVLIEYLYGTLQFDSPSTGIYSTANAGGTPITVDVVYQ